MNDQVRDRVEKAAASVLGGGEPVDIERGEIRPEYVRQIVGEYLERWGQAADALIVADTAEGATVGRPEPPKAALGAALGRPGDTVSRARRSVR